MISDFALFLFTTLAGAAAGAYVARAIVPLEKDRRAPWAFALTSLILLGVSGVALLAHLGHPELVLNAFNNLGAGIAQEGVTTMLFGVLVLVDCILCFAKKESPRWLVIVTAILGVAMTVTMGLAYAAFIGEPAWAGSATAPFFVLGDLAMGAGLYLAFNLAGLADMTYKTYFVAIQIAAAVALIAIAVQFANSGFNFIPFVVAIILGPLASSIACVKANHSNRTTLAWVACAFAVVGIVIARYAFYAASLF